MALTQSNTFATMRGPRRRAAAGRKKAERILLKDERMKKRQSRSTVPDRHALYEVAVQGVDWDLDFLERSWCRGHPGREPRTFREDFCSTAALAVAWAQRGPRRRSWAVDLDPEPLRWARKCRLPFVREAARRVTLVRSDVRRAQKQKVDVACALNFSWWVFHQRRDLLAYLRAARAGLMPGGVLVLNAFGGTRAECKLIERTRKGPSNAPDGTALPGFTYIWEHAHLNALDRQLVAYIHFELRDGRRLRRAFTYDWRMWTLPELREAALEAGFSEFEVWAEGWDAHRRTHTGTLHRRVQLDQEDSWVAYAVCRR